VRGAKGAMPIPVESLFDTTLTTLAAMESVRTGKEVALADSGKL
jgi:hypothetical protein